MPTPNPTSICRETSGNLASPKTRIGADPAVFQEARYLSWQLGFKLGFAAGAASAGIANDTQLAKLMEETQPLADALGVQAPRLPEIQHVANALHEFEVYIEADPQCVATELARRFSSQHGSLYKFGVAVGIATVYRAAVPEGGALFAVQIRHYGKLAAIPQALWLPMTQDSLDAIPGADPKEKVLTLVGNIDGYIRQSK